MQSTVEDLKGSLVTAKATAHTTTTPTTTSAPAEPERPEVRVFNIGTVEGAADATATRLRDADWNVTETGNLELPDTTVTTVFFGDTPGEQQAAEEIRQLPLDVMAVTFQSGEVVDEYVRQSGWPWPFLVDPDRELYNAYAMYRGGLWAIWGPRSWWGFLKLLLRGRRLNNLSVDARRRSSNPHVCNMHPHTRC